MDKKTCFIIMPVTTPETSGRPYSDDKSHFTNVLEHFFKPAIQQIGFKAIPPKASGSDVIQAEIVKHLELSDLVLCDISSLNANVFFELGIRTALDKPVAFVKDELTQKIPFDTGIINHHTYEIRPWNMKKAIDDLAEHLKQSFEGCKGTNPLWKYFGLKKAAEIKPDESPVNAKLDLIQMMVERLTNSTSSVEESDSGSFFTKERLDRIRTIAHACGVTIDSTDETPNPRIFLESGTSGEGYSKFCLALKARFAVPIQVEIFPF